MLTLMTVVLFEAKLNEGRSGCNAIGGNGQFDATRWRDVLAVADIPWCFFTSPAGIICSSLA
ncbi:hypothetical protein ACVCIC_18335 [Burkholderia glumae]|uniref:Uncharacterized protein n=1 Tax=Burkholderia glumae TaxID=337 RepID=A0AAP9Y9D3_BURGL|nr:MULTISPECIES: hypothetical protein [Burkholderia]AJY65858.1 hypothetical protein KS03_2126 [Burkholderia glumae LMG 2196 = ATCC 33617]QPQ93900.1 hypothetical protein I6H06_17090 [Burkholderia glumae]QQM90899.1 hypothetical protein I6G78_17555 [Burkholderia glumae]USS47200.1 hypothetical protein NFI99_20245 [Burkholderia glumae]